MNAQRVPEEFISEAEYRLQERSAEIRHEYYNGRVYAMAGASIRHNDICLAAGAALRNQLRGQPCRPRVNDQLLKIEATGMLTYPDVIVSCPPFRQDGEEPEAMLDAVVIVEVLSRPTQRYDRNEKFGHYRQLPGLRHYILIDQYQVSVECRDWTSPGNWVTRIFTNLEDVVELSAIGCQLTLAELYEGIEFED